jgi:hypothetical protein
VLKQELSPLLHHFAYSELFFASSHSTVSSLDLRNGRLLYTYKGEIVVVFVLYSCNLYDTRVGISGAVNALAPSKSYLVTTSLDRLVGLYSTTPPGKVPGSARQEGAKPEVLDKLFWKFTPTVVCWDGKSDLEGTLANGSAVEQSVSEDSEGEDCWRGIGAASEHDSESERSGNEGLSKRRKRE